MQLLQSCLTSQSHGHWTEFVGRLQPGIAGAILRTFSRYASGGRPARDQVDDLVQQTYLRLCDYDYRVLRKLESQDEPSLLAYVRTVAINLTIDHLRGNSRVFEPLDPSMRREDGNPTEHFALIDTINRHLAVCAGVDAMRSRRIFWLYYRSGLTSKAISEIAGLGLGQKGVESLLLRLARCVRRAIAEGIRGSKPFHTGGRSIGAAT